MNKFLKITLLAALAMVLLGAVLSLAGKAAGGRYQVDEMYYNNELNIPFTGYNYNNWNVSEEDSVDVYKRQQLGKQGVWLSDV